MSAPDTNTEKQAEKHKAPLRMGIMFPILWGVGLLVVFVLFMVFSGDSPEGADEAVDSRTGDVVDQPTATGGD